MSSYNQMGMPASQNQGSFIQQRIVPNQQQQRIQQMQQMQRMRQLPQQQQTQPQHNSNAALMAQLQQQMGVRELDILDIPVFGFCIEGWILKKAGQFHFSTR
jgi:hypothetical protein